MEENRGEQTQTLTPKTLPYSYSMRGNQWAT